MEAATILQGLTLLGIGGVGAYLFRVEHRLTRIETKICNNKEK